MENTVYVGFEPREADAFAVCVHSIEQNRRLRSPPDFFVRSLVLKHLREQGLYYRPTVEQDGHLFDVISEHAMATEFAISRFLVPHLVRTQSRYKGDRWAVFMDCDMLVTADLGLLFEQANPKFAVQVVKHDYAPTDTLKMDGQVQSQYARKNWSSVILWNVDHPAHDFLTPEIVNSLPGRDLHGFKWLQDDEIGELPSCWNFLVGHDPYHASKTPPAIIHFTEGTPSMKGHAHDPYADTWRDVLNDWAAL